MKGLYFKRVVLIAVGVGVFFSWSVDARRIKGDTPQDDLTEKLRSCIKDYYDQYGEEVAESVAQALTEMFPELESLRSITDPQERLKALADMIKEKISYDEGITDFPEIVEKRKANCLGYAQLVDVLGNAVGLSVAIIGVYSENLEENHAANVIWLNNYSRSGPSPGIIVDLSGEKYYMSPLFYIDNEYEELGEIWGLDQKSEIDGRYGVIRFIAMTNLVRAAIENNRGVRYAKDGNLEAAKKAYTQAIELDENCRNAYFNRGKIYFKHNQFDDAIADFDEAIRINPCDAKSYLERGHAYFKEEEFKKAIDDFTLVADSMLSLYIDSKGKADAFYCRGMAEDIQGNQEQAKEDYKKAAELLMQSEL